MITAHTRTLALTLGTIITVQKISKRNAALDEPEVVIDFTVDSEGTVIATHTRPDGRFAMIVPDAKGTPGFHFRTNIHLLKAVLGDFDGDTATLSTGPLGAPMLMNGNTATGLLRRVSTTPLTPTTALVNFGKPIGPLRRAAMKALAAAAAAADGRSGIPALSSIAIRHRAGRIETAATDNVRAAVNHVTAGDGGREGNPDAPVMVLASTLTALTRLPADEITMYLSATEPSAHADTGVGSIRITTPTWTFERATVDCQHPVLGPHVDMNDPTLSLVYTGSVAVSATDLDKAVRQGNGGLDKVALQFLTAPDGQRQIVFGASDQVGVANAIDLMKDEASTMEPFDRMLINPALLKSLTGSIRKGGVVELSWGHLSTDPARGRRVRLQHADGVALLAAYRAEATVS